MNTQDAPIQDGSDDSTNDEQVSGIIEQVRADIDMGHTHEDVLVLLRQRFSETGTEVSNERMQQLAEQLRNA